MVFNSLSFLVFFSAFFFLYWFVFNKSEKSQNLILLIGSYVFYEWAAEWRFLGLLIGISAFNYFLGIQIQKGTKYKRLLLYLGLIQGIGCLAFFKYFNFFIDSFNDAFHSLNVNLNLQTLNIIIPLGISFFTFRTMSYLLDVEKGKIEATKNWLVFFNYVAFFPAILSGPIDKAKLFFPQIEKRRNFEYKQATDGLRQFLWGLFKKMVIADNFASYTSEIFENYQTLSGSTLLLGAFFYAIQVYADFSAYSDMAIGVARLIGFEMTRNFNFPFFAQNIAEFWRKWHISLTSWLTEYVFTPLSITFRDMGKLGLIFAIIINFTICGIWHGANWTYILFGFVHGCFFIPLILKGTMNKKKKDSPGKNIPSLREFIKIISTFTLVMFSFIIFKAQTVSEAITIFSKIFSSSIFAFPRFIGIGKSVPILIITFGFLIIEWFGRNQQYAIANFNEKFSTPIRWAIYYGIILIIFLFYGSKQQFIYFQF
jgi:D-alanyl-lipoteichoic acid acyltransferase DltB (MBOAT superfamily)